VDVVKKLKIIVIISLIAVVFVLVILVRRNVNPKTQVTSPDALMSRLPNVTPERLLNPPDGDWLQWGRTYDGLSFSPLKNINRKNVNKLNVAWRKEISGGGGMPAPLVHEGILFLQTTSDSLLALDGTNGKILWRYRFQPSTASTKKMGIALSGDKVFLPTSDGHIVALNFKTGAVIWDHKIEAKGPIDLRGAPLIVHDRVIQGAPGSLPGGGFIVALDIFTGDEVWRFQTVAQPNTPGGNTWNDLPLEERTGGSVWHQGTYDPELNLVFFGTAPTYHTAALIEKVHKPGVTNEALYTDCTVALNPDDGKLMWFYQHFPNDQWDLDWVFERQIVTMKVDGKDRKVVMSTGKLGITEGLDAKTGKYLFSIDAGIQNIISSIDSQTGVKKISQEKLPFPQKITEVCPSMVGARSWPPTSYNQKTEMLFVPLLKLCTRYGESGHKVFSTRIPVTFAEHPEAKRGTLGRLQAVNVNSKKLSWAAELESPLSTSVLGTAGGLIFAGDIEPSLKAFDDSNGKLLWTAKLDDFPSSNVISYSVGEKQYVAVVAGLRNALIRDFLDARDLWRNDRGLPKAKKLESHPAVWVFAL
jgi:alcohol dehydrogenase (cytochrome c)